jgi:hypothetical protein
MILIHDRDEIKTVSKRQKQKTKPLCILDHNQYMGGVDLKDQLLQSYLVERKQMIKWFMKLFQRLLNSTVLNALILYRENTGKRIEQLSYWVQLVEGLFIKYGTMLNTKYQGDIHLIIQCCDL